MNSKIKIFLHVFFLFIFFTNPLRGQNSPNLQHILNNFERVNLPFEIDGNRVNNVYTNITQKDSAYLWQLFITSNLEKVNPLYESGFGSLDDEREYLDDEKEIKGGSIIKDAEKYILICYRINEVGILMSINKKSGLFISGLICENYRGMGHAQVGRDVIITKEEVIKIEESSWGRNFDEEDSYSLKSEFIIDGEGYLVLKKLIFQN